MKYPVLKRDGSHWPPWLGLGLLALGLIATPARAEEATAKPEAPSSMELKLKQLMQLEIPTVYGATKHEQPTTEVPSSVTVLTADEVRLYGYRTLGDILKSVQGMDVSYDRDYQYLGVRGFNRQDYPNSRVLVLVDGHRVNHGLSDGAYIDTGFILDIDLIDKVEVIRGPGSVLYGNNAVFGVINVVTRRGADLHGFEVTGWGGSQETGRGRITYGNKFKNEIDVLVSGSYQDSQGQGRLFFPEFNSPAFNHGVAVNGDFDRFRSGFSSVSYHDFTVEGGYVWREKGNPTAPYAVVDPTNPGYAFGAAFNDPRTRTTDQRAYMDLKFDHHFTEDAQLTSRLYYDRSDFDGANVYKDPVLGLDTYHAVEVGQRFGAELQLSKRFFDRHLFTVGAEYIDDFDQRLRTYDEVTGTQYANVQETRVSKGVFAQGDIAVRTNLHLNAGVRYDKYGEFDGTANPRLALIYHPLEKSTLKAIYGTAFRAPNFFETYQQSTTLALKPETITTYELVYEQQFGAFSSSVAGFYNRMNDLVSLLPDPAGGLSYQNAAGADARGLEFALAGTGPLGVKTRMSYTLQKTRDRATGLLLTDSPEHLAKFNLSVPVFKEKLFASAEWEYTSRRTTLLGTESAGFGVVNFVVFGQKVWKGLDLSVGVYNVLDRHYFDPATPNHVQGLIPQEGRTVLGKATFRF